MELSTPVAAGGLAALAACGAYACVRSGSGGADGSSALAGAKLLYFGIPGRGEPVRLALALSGQSWSEDVIEFSKWGELKPTIAFGGLPAIRLADGSEMGQTRAIMRFVGRCAGLYPLDAVEACKVDQVMDAVDDLTSGTNKVGQGLEQPEKEAKRAEAAAEGGSIARSWDQIEAFIGANGSDGYCVGSSLTVADIFVATMPPFTVTGFFDGVPKSLCERYPKMQAVRKTVYSLPAVQGYYASLEKVNDYQKFLMDVTKC